MFTYRKVGVAVWDTAYCFDKLFTYASFEPVEPGCRVAVPFGAGNTKRVGMVLTVSDETEDDGETGVIEQGFKPVSFVMDKEPLLNKEQLELVYRLRDAAFCTYCDAIKAILPAGMQVEICQRAQLVDSFNEGVLSEEEMNFIRFLRREKTTRNFDRLLSVGENKEKEEIIEALYKKGVLVNSHYAKQKVGKAGVKTLSLAENFEEAARLVSVTPKQQKLIDLLKEQQSISEKEACYLCGITSAVVKNAEKSGLVESRIRDVYRDIMTVKPSERKNPDDIALTELQQSVYEEVRCTLSEKKPSCFLLHGVTGSGKTSVFMKLIKDTIAMDKQVIMLVPEIALTPQIVREFVCLFGETVTVIHSELSMGQRSDAYRRIRNGSAKIVIGTRSAVFAPAENLGLIIVDEEGERAYKSDSPPRYHAIDVAKVRCRSHGATLLLASATPSVESYYYAEKGVYKLLTMKERYSNRPLPKVTIVDMNDERQHGNDTEFSDELIIALRENLAAKEQSILLLNRRGYHTIISCCDCNTPVYCPNCSVPMTYHKVNGSLMCHYCGHTGDMAEKCSSCGGTHFRKMGFGTQTLEEALSAAVPKARILRMDADTTMSRNSYEEKFAAFARGEYDIMIGTQMIGKGLNFPNVTLVGVLSVDKALFAGDFRSYERTFSLITQVVGRGGRGDKPGRAILQTFMPEHYVLKLAANQNYEDFYREEIALRRTLIFPPVCDICTLGFVSPVQKDAAAAADYAAVCLSEIVRQTFFNKPLRVLGPMPFSYERIGGKYRYRLILKCKNTKEYRDLVREVIKAVHSQKTFSKVYIYADINGDIGI